MAAKLIKQEVGPWPMNCYVLKCTETNAVAIFDPGADPEKILSNITETNFVEAIILTHGHVDHVGALDQIKELTSAPVMIHPKDADHFNISFDIPITDGDLISIGNLELRAIYTPGHTPGQTCFDIGDGRIIVGDTIFVGGPGRTWSPEDFSTTMNTMQETVFLWSNRTEFFPGHGPSGIIGEERPSFEKFLRKGWHKKLHGDITWE